MSNQQSEFDIRPMSLAHELVQMLEAIIDTGTVIDTGGSDGTADLWPIIDGVEYRIHIEVNRLQEVA